MPLIGDVKISIGDADILVTDTGETYWIKSAPDFKEKPDSSVVFGRWYYQGDQDSEYAIILTLNEDGTYTKGNWNHTIPFGILHSPAPSNTVQKFLDVVRQVY